MHVREQLGSVNVILKEKHDAMRIASVTGFRYHVLMSMSDEHMRTIQRMRIKVWNIREAVQEQLDGQQVLITETHFDNISRQ
jgi:hypothetical protein